MKEELIKFETAKLAKEKGFGAQNPTKAYYTTLGEYDMSTKYSFENPHHYAMVSQSLLQKWLREVHDIDIEIEHIQYPEKRIYVGSIYSDRVEEESGDYIEFDTYEEALEDCLKDALSIIP